MEVLSPKTRTNVYRDRNLQLVFLITMISIMGVNIVTPAFPSVVRELGISPQDVGLLVTVFTLPGIFLTPVYGILADRYGRKKILVPSLFIFGIAGAMCGVVRSFDIILIFRFIQGAASASLSTLNLAIIGDLYDGNTRTTAVGYNASLHSIAAASYPIIGGLLTTLGWFFPFLVPLIAIPVGIIILYYLNSPEPRTQRSFLSEMQTTLKYFKTKQVAGLLLAALFTFILLYGGYLTYFPFVIEPTITSLPLALSPIIIGLIISSRPLATSISSSRLGIVSKTRSVKQLIMLSFVLIGISFLLVSWISIVWLFLIPSIIYGIAMGIGIPSIQNQLIELVPMESRGQVMAAFGMAVRLGQTIGPLLMGFFFSIWGLSQVFLAGIAIAVLALIFTQLLLPKNIDPINADPNISIKKENDPQ